MPKIKTTVKLPEEELPILKHLSQDCKCVEAHLLDFGEVEIEGEKLHYNILNVFFKKNDWMCAGHDMCGAVWVLGKRIKDPYDGRDRIVDIRAKVRCNRDGSWNWIIYSGEDKITPDIDITGVSPSRSIAMEDVGKLLKV